MPAAAATPSWERTPASTGLAKDDFWVIFFMGVFLAVLLGNQASFVHLLFSYSSATPGLDFSIQAIIYLYVYSHPGARV